MIYKPFYLPLAEMDLDEILLYLSQYSPETSAKFLTELKDRLELLRKMPRMHPHYPKNRKYRFMVVQKYLVFYIIAEDTKAIAIHRILHAAMDNRKHLE